MAAQSQLSVPPAPGGDGDDGVVGVLLAGEHHPQLGILDVLAQPGLQGLGLQQHPGVIPGQLQGGLQVVQLAGQALGQGDLVGEGAAPLQDRLGRLGRVPEPGGRGLLLDLFQFQQLALGVQVGAQLLHPRHQFILGPHQALKVHVPSIVSGRPWVASLPL